MSRVLYVEPDEEITDLVERIRNSGDDKDLVFVLPNRARVLQSPLNLRLLQQYSRSFEKRSAIVSGDPRVQNLSRQAGLTTFASVAAWERGVEVTRPLPPEDPAEVDIEAAIDPLAIGGAAGVATAASTRGSRPPAPPPAVAAAAVLRGPQRRTRLYVLATALVVVGLLLLFLVAPSATVTITINAQPVKVSKLIQGTTDPTAAAGPDHVATQVVEADESQAFQAKPTGQKQIPAATAAGALVMTTDLRPQGACITGIRKGQTFFQTASNPPVVFLANADIVSNSQNPQCLGLYVPPPAADANGGTGAPSDPVPVVAQVAGNAGNVPAGAISVWPNNPCNPPPSPPPNFVQTCAPKDLQVANPQATGGGVDQHTITVASDADVQQFKQSQQNLDNQIRDKVKADMQAKAPNDVFAVDPSGQGLTLTDDVSPGLPSPGDQYSPTQITVHVHGKAAMYNPDQVKGQISDDLKHTQVSPDQELVADPPPRTAVNITQAADDGTVVFNASESGFVQPIVDTAGLKSTLTGKSKTGAAQAARQFIDPGGKIVQSVDVSQSIPFFVLPYFSSRIQVDIRVVPPSGPSS